MKKILVPVDFSDLSTDLIEKAGEIAGAFDGEVFILHVIMPVSVFSDDPSQMTIYESQGMEEYAREEQELKAMAGFLEGKGIKTRSALVYGPVVHTVLHEAEKFEADLIIIGSHSHGFLYRAFIGSVSDGIIRNSNCAVMVVPQR